MYKYCQKARTYSTFKRIQIRSIEMSYILTNISGSSESQGITRYGLFQKLLINVKFRTRFLCRRVLSNSSIHIWFTYRRNTYFVIAVKRISTQKFADIEK
ncbi:hypothetical protein CIPAW_07G132200 [Carya illinoinensis]|uniref:Uncharacterized protein n=1 Tax=Carya illinoinensis TaxID=32201 RepID=A0A8T1Q4N4_CARIL|nr:hypothetical protein CIPAW_07G132200 [Carya illinoinensis]